MENKSAPIRVLVIDDDSMSRELLTVLLAGEGHAVEAAESGDAALELLADAPSPPHVVLADIQMPGTSGSLLAEGLRRACGPGTLLLAMSGSGPPPEAIANFDGFLLKPFTLRQMAQVMQAWGDSADARRASSLPREASKDAMQPLADLEEGTVAGLPDTVAGDGVLDEKIYEQLMTAMPPEQLHQMYAMCLEDARVRIESMRSEAVQLDLPQFTRQAHSIKGCCGMLGATELYGLAGRLELAGPEAITAIAKKVNPLDELTAACDRLQRILGARA